MTSILGSSTDDTGWVDPFAFAACEGTIARRVDWGVLSLLFTDLSPLANGRRHFIGYEYGRVGQVGDDPVGLHTPGGITLGSRVVDLLAEFPEATVNPGEAESQHPRQLLRQHGVLRVADRHHAGRLRDGAVRRLRLRRVMRDRPIESRRGC